MNILSIQSHVAYGHVGNSAASFPLQRLGFNIWPVPTVLFSNHAGYETVHGPVLRPDEVADILSGLEERRAFTNCDILLSGYLGSVDLGRVVLDSARAVKQASPSADYCCDPVMGDRGKSIYVKPEIPDFMRSEAVPLADILTPNHFELELLSGHKVTSLDEALGAARHLQDQGPHTVLVTSLDRGDVSNSLIEMLAVGRDEAWLVATPRLAFEVTPNGGGDITAALFAALLRSRDSLDEALEQTAAIIFGLYDRSRELGRRELALVEAQAEIVAPSRWFQAERVG